MPDSVIYASTVALVLAYCWYSQRRGPASPGPGAEKATGTRPGADPQAGGVASAPSHLDIFAEAFVQQGRPGAGQFTPSDLSNAAMRQADSPALPGLPPPGAPAVLYWWRKPHAAKRMMLADPKWELEFIDVRYGSWLLRKEERWP